MLLTGLLVGSGVVAVTAGAGRYAADRWRHRRESFEGRRIAPGVLLTAAGSGLVLSPDVMVLADQLQVADPAGALALGIYNVLALGGLGTVGAGMWLTSRRVTQGARRGIESTLDAIPVVARRRAGRRGTPQDFPREWAGLVALDTELTHRFLRYENDLEAGVNFPVMQDYSDPLTRGALDAMMRCRELRAMAPPPGTRDVRDTDYARAVADFQVALEAAEANAERLVASTFTDDERRTLEAAAATLEFMRQATTTPTERAAAYDQVASQLAQLPLRLATATQEAREQATATAEPSVVMTAEGEVLLQGEGGATRVARRHPFLAVQDRSRR